MLTNRAYRLLTYLFGSINILFVLVILSQGAEQLLVDWKTALYQIVIPCALNILFAMCWMIGAGLRRPALIATFKYFSFVQMALLAGIILYAAYYGHKEGLSSSLMIVMCLLISLFFLSLMEVLTAVGTEHAIAKEREIFHLRPGIDIPLTLQRHDIARPPGSPGSQRALNPKDYQPHYV
ncbi:AGAP006377-PA-like protein [Anopheles sinensis]|uniref:AGAP006377-PA-like protein n=1 Tax=Anopheles sinensis TaxID=74873 RepID=A0A084WEH3_ANOSI|nr:AGAP006377-PA-like protein [Anopheles sinensis]